MNETDPNERARTSETDCEEIDPNLNELMFRARFCVPGCYPDRRPTGNSAQVVAHRTLGINPLGIHPLRFAVRDGTKRKYRTKARRETASEAHARTLFQKSPGFVLKFLYERCCVAASRDRSWLVVRDHVVPKSRGTLPEQTATDGRRIIVKRKAHTSGWRTLERLLQNQPDGRTPRSGPDGSTEDLRYCIKWAQQLRDGIRAFRKMDNAQKVNFSYPATVFNVHPTEIASCDNRRRLVRRRRRRRNKMQRNPEFNDVRGDEEEEETARIITNNFFQCFRNDPNTVATVATVPPTEHDPK